MNSKIITAERKLDDLLPPRRPEQSAPAALMTAAGIWSEQVWARAEQLGPMTLSDVQVVKGNEFARHPVYVCGVHRSGTTLVRDLLDGHPELVVLPSEGTYYTNLEAKLLALPDNQRAAFLGKEWLRRLINPMNQPPYWLLGRSSDMHSPYVDFARYVMAWWQKVSRKNRQWPHLAVVLSYASCTDGLEAKLWVDKTPANERFLGRIWMEMPSAKIIQVIRHPYATLASRKTMEPALKLGTALRDLKMSFRVALEQSLLHTPGVLLVRYEDLCDNPQLMTEKMALFLHIHPSDSLSQPTVAGIPTKANSSFNKEPAWGQVLKPDEHRQPEVLSLAEKALIAAHIGKLAEKLNYPLTHVGLLKKVYIRLKYGLL
ncbi:MAG: sulfotransferase [Mucilaginibacter sp.]|nr:sulfotransferase [Mucilaginibacter sp.]